MVRPPQQGVAAPTLQEARRLVIVVPPPGMAPPVVMGSHTCRLESLVELVLIEQLPVVVMAHLTSEVVVVVDVAPDIDLNVRVFADLARAGRAHLRHDGVGLDPVLHPLHERREELLPVDASATTVPGIRVREEAIELLLVV